MPTQNFIKLSRHDYANEIDWIIDLLIISTGAKPLMEQYNTRCGIQAGPVENNRDLVKDEDYLEINDDLAAKITKDTNWDSLCRGLAVGSTKTIEWLERHGIRPVVDTTYAHEPHPTHRIKAGILPDDVDIAF